MNEADLELLQRELDGETAPDEHERLCALLERDAAARKTFDDLRMLAAELRDLPLEEPPPHLWTDVMDRLPHRRSTLRPRSWRAWSALSERVTARPALPFLYAFAIGLLAGVALFGLVDSKSTSDEELYGLLTAQEEIADTAGAHETTVALPGFDARMTVHATNSLVVVQIDVEAADATEMHITPEEGLLLKGITRRTDDPAPAFEASGNQVHLRLSGSQRYTVMYNRTASLIPPIRIEIIRNGERLFIENVEI